jgi:hypothetical protein
MLLAVKNVKLLFALIREVPRVAQLLKYPVTLIVPRDRVFSRTKSFTVRLREFARLNGHSAKVSFSRIRRVGGRITAHEAFTIFRSSTTRRWLLRHFARHNHSAAVGGLRHTPDECRESSLGSPFFSF